MFAAHNAAVLSRAGYDGAATGCLEVLHTERPLFGAGLAEPETLRLYFNSVIELYKAPGGGRDPASWSAKPTGNRISASAQVVVRTVQPVVAPR